MRTARLLTVSRSAGGSAQRPWMQSLPLEADTPHWRQIPPGYVTCDHAGNPTPSPLDRRNDRRLRKYCLAPNFVYGR